MGCQAATEGLGSNGGLDAGQPDSAADTGIWDAGPERLDAATEPDAGSACNSPGELGFEIINVDAGFEGRASVESVRPLRLRTDQGLMEFRVPEEVPLTRFVSVGQRVYLTLELNRPWWTEVRMLIQTLGPDNRPSGAAFAIWSGAGFYEFSTQNLTLRHVLDACEYDNGGCGRQGGMAQVVRIGAERIVVQNGDQGVIGNYLVANRGSTTLLEPTQCSDSPTNWYAGWVISQGPQLLDCSTLRRDDCIVQPGCVLWGSENKDPGYTCVPAADPCEFRDAETCASGPGCTWDWGDCYCPEDVDCDCGGGSAPKCRTDCAGWTGRECPASHYCALDLVEPAICVAPADVGGTCEWVPETCAGTPDDPVCTCLPDDPDPQLLENDCQRRQRRGQGSSPRNFCAP